ncbi:MAG: SAM-dependent methyltransferase [Leptolyngbya sp. Prado105]|nr:SAM-dependent methyltransferase [Leptolyngbya sp. Prado105]
MTGTLIRNVTTPEVFFCPEESHFYSHCLERLVFSHCTNCDLIVEFGAGDGSPVINSLMRSRFDSVIHGFELNSAAYEVAKSRVDQYDLHHQYIVHNQSFFDSAPTNAGYLIANPPYIPAPDDQIRMPLLHGGTDGATLTNRLLTLGYPNVMLLVSSYSNPIETLQCAADQGYTVADFMVTPLKFGCYSSEPKVKKWIAQLRDRGQAFYSQNIYFLAGVLFKRSGTPDLTNELIQVMTAL